MADFVDKVENLAAQNFREIPIMPKIAAARPVGVAYSVAQGAVGDLAGGTAKISNRLAMKLGFLNLSTKRTLSTKSALSFRSRVSPSRQLTDQ